MLPIQSYPILTALLIAPLAIWTFDRIRARGFPEGWWLPWFCALLLVPVWIWSAWGSFRMDVRTAAALAVLVGLLLQPWHEGLRLRFMWADAWVLAIIGSQSLTEFTRELLAPLTPFEQMRDVGLPYLMGRLCMLNSLDLRRMLPAVCGPMVFLSIYAIFESVTKVNLLAMLTGRRWELLETSEGFRWGLKRAQGPLHHPIYLGMMIVLMLPWMLEARQRAKAGEGPTWWLYMPALAVVAMVGTVSRAAQLATVMTLGADFIFRHPRWRGLMLLLVMVGGGIGLSFRDEILAQLSKLAGEGDPGKETVKIAGESYPYSGTLHRDLLQIVYKKAVDEVGPLGYGSQREHMPVDNDTDERFSSIDDQYLVYYLRYGPVGMACFLGFAACVCLYLLYEAWKLDSPHAGFCGALFGAFLGNTLLVKGVAMEPDFAWVWMFCGGVAARLHEFRSHPQGVAVPPPA